MSKREKYDRRESMVDEIIAIPIRIDLPLGQVLWIRRRLMMCCCSVCAALADKVMTQVAASVSQAELTPLTSHVMDQAMAHEMNLCEQRQPADEDDDVLGPSPPTPLP